MPFGVCVSQVCAPWDTVANAGSNKGTAELDTGTDKRDGVGDASVAATAESVSEQGRKPSCEAAASSASRE